MKEYYRLHAQFCRSIASPKRLEIIDRLRNGPMSVSELARTMGVSPSNISQHLTVMKNQGVITGDRQGTTVFYRLAIPEVLQAYDLMSSIMKDLLRERSQKLEEMEGVPS